MTRRRLTGWALAMRLRRIREALDRRARWWREYDMHGALVCCRLGGSLDAWCIARRFPLVREAQP